MSEIEENPALALNAAQTAYRNGDHDNGLLLLKRLKSFPNSNRIAIKANEELVQWALGCQWLSGYQSDYEHCIGKLKERVKNENTSTRACLIYNETVLAFHARRWSIVIENLQELLASNASTHIRVEGSLLLAECYLKLCDPERALAALTKIDGDLLPDLKENGTITESQKHRHFVAKVRCCLTMRNIRRCKKELKSVPADISPHPWTILLFKAQQEYLRDNYRKSIRLIMNADESSPSDQEEMNQRFCGRDDCLAAIFNNALGCNYAKMNKFHLAASYFEKAINEYAKIREATKPGGSGKEHDTLPVYAEHQTGYWSTVHNYALALLQAGFAERAFDCFIQIVKVYPKNSRLWLRLAECCIIVRQKNNSADFNLDQRRHECISEVIGIGPHRKILLNPNLANRKRGSFEQGAMPALTYEFAYLCLKNALLVLPKINQDHLRTITESPTNSSSSSSEKEIILLWPSPPQSPMGVKEIYRLKCSILCATSYVCLSVNEYLPALESAKALLAMEHISPLHKLLGHFYASESLIFLNRLQEAATHLSLDPVMELTMTEFSSGTGQGLPPVDWSPKNSKTATLALLYNVGVVCNLMGESAKAMEITKLVRAGIQNGVDCPVLAIAQTLYQLLNKEQVENAKTILCRFFPYLQIGEQQTIT